MYAVHCDREGCDTWERTDGEFAPFVDVVEGDDLLGSFCTLDCLTHWAAAASEPTVGVDQ